MRMMIGAAVALVLTAAPAWTADAKYALTGENTKIEFVGTKPDGKHTGGFKEVTGTATVPDGDLTKAKIEVEISMDSTYTDNPMLTNHLKGPDFFGVKTNPKAKFVTTKIEKSDAGYNVTGDLTLVGTTKSVTFPAKLTAADGTLKLTSEFKINRHDHGITFGKGKIDDDVALKLAVEAKK
jgi:polyisoprenoid-binding protein YceI